MHEQAHVSFPLVQPSRHVATTGMLTTQFTPQTDLEKAIDEIQKCSICHSANIVCLFRSIFRTDLASNLNEDKILKDEWLAQRDLDPEELAQREAELMKMKHLMFYKERKLKVLLLATCSPHQQNC